MSGLFVDRKTKAIPGRRHGGALERRDQGASAAEGANSEPRLRAPSDPGAWSLDATSVSETSGSPWNPSGGEGRGVGLVELVGDVAGTDPFPGTRERTGRRTRRRRRDRTDVARDRRRSDVTVVDAPARRAAVLSVVGRVAVMASPVTRRGRVCSAMTGRVLTAVHSARNGPGEGVMERAVSEPQGLPLRRREEHDGEEEG